MAQLPESLKYGCSQSQARVVRSTIMPSGVSTGTTSAQTEFRFKLPEKSLIDLKSLALYYDYTVTGLTDDAANFSNALLPAAYKHFSQVKFYVSGAVAANAQCNHYDIAYHSLVRASGSEDWVNSRWNNGLSEIAFGADALGTKNITARPGAVVAPAAHFTYDDMLGLCNSKNHVLDTSLFGSCEVSFVMSNNTAIKSFVNGTVTAGALQAALVGTITNIKACIDTVVSISPLYVSLLAERLQVDSPIRLPFQNLVTSVSSSTGSNRLTLNSSCVDAIMIAPYSADPNAFGVVADNNTLNAPRYKFNSGRTIDNANVATVQFCVGADVYPRQPIRVDECADLTTNSIYGNSAKSSNLLFSGLAAGVQSYSRLAYLTENCVIIQKFSLGEEGWATGQLQGIDCSGVQTDIVVNTSNFPGFIFICALLTSQLVFSPQTSSVSVQS